MSFKYVIPDLARLAVEAGVAYFNLFQTRSQSDHSENIQCMTGMTKKAFNTGNKTNSRYLSMMKLSNYDTYCSNVHCTIGPMNTDESALIRFRFRLWSKNLAMVSFGLFVFSNN
jgi:hypothetical protein